MPAVVVVGVSGGIAVYKTCEVVSSLRKLGYIVKVVMTKNATEFVSPLTFETLSNNRVLVDMFEEKPNFEVEHISLAKEASAFLIAPATANVIAKIAYGIADDMLTTTFLAHKGVKIICPAMNTNMYNDPTLTENLKTLKDRGMIILEPNEGFLACGDVGKGRMVEAKEIVSCVDKILTPTPDCRGKKFLISAGATIEDIDRVRFISNYSSGKMGMALAKVVLERGGEVTLVCARVSVPTPKGCKVINVKSTDDMYKVIMEELDCADVIIKSAACSDYKIKESFDQKIKSDTLTLELVKNVDIASEVGKVKGDKKLVVFSAETTDLLKNAQAKLIKKNGDIIVANDVTKENAGFDVDTNIATLIFREGKKVDVPLTTKEKLAHIIIDGVLSL